MKFKAQKHGSVEQDQPNNPYGARLSGEALLWGILGVALIVVFRGLVLTQTPMQLFFDEAQYWSWGLTPDFGYFSKPPVLSWLIRGFTEVCGTGEACIRFTSPVLYGITALVCGFLASRIARRMSASANAAFIWAALLFATLPGVSFAARLVSTDAPLLLCFALALLFLDRLRGKPSVLDALGLGAAFGFGLMSKYAMIYLVLCAVIWVLVSREGRRVLLQPLTLFSVTIAAVIVAPNIWWNAKNGWITFHHTKDNGHWEGLSLHFDNMAEFTGAQIGIIGPVLFIALVSGLWRLRGKLSGDAVFLLCFSLPVTLLMIVQATISRAHANWAAVTFVALTVLTVCWLVSWRAKPLLLAAGLVHGMTVLALGVGDLYSDKILHHPIGYSYKRVFGWEELAEKLTERANESGTGIIVAEGRSTVVQLLYYMKDQDFEIRTWPPKGRPRNHFEMSIPLAVGDKGPVLVVSHCTPGKQAANVSVLGPLVIAVRENFQRHYFLYRALDNMISPSDICGKSAS